MVYLVGESGYPDHRQTVTDDAIEHYFVEHSEAMDDWELLSLDSRSSDAWFIQSVSTSRDVAWCVGRGSESHTFPNRIRASAFYVRRFVESIYNHHFNAPKSKTRNA